MPFQAETAITELENAAVDSVALPAIQQDIFSVTDDNGSVSISEAISSDVIAADGGDNELSTTAPLSSLEPPREAFKSNVQDPFPPLRSEVKSVPEHPPPSSGESVSPEPPSSPPTPLQCETVSPSESSSPPVILSQPCHSPSRTLGKTSSRRRASSASSRHPLRNVASVDKHNAKTSPSCKSQVQDKSSVASKTSCAIGIPRPRKGIPGSLSIVGDRPNKGFGSSVCHQVSQFQRKNSRARSRPKDLDKVGFVQEVNNRKI